MEMGSTLLDSRPPQLPHKPFPTTTSFRVTNGFEVTASSSNQHPLGPAPPGSSHANTPPPHHISIHSVSHVTHQQGGHISHGHHNYPAASEGHQLHHHHQNHASTAAAAAAAAKSGALHNRSSSTSSFMDPSRLMALPPLKVPRDAARPPHHPISAAAKSAAEVTPPPATLHPASCGSGGRLTHRLKEGEKDKAASSVKGKGTSTTTPSSADLTGWQGLLEFSRSSGAAGVLGPVKSEADEQRHKRSTAEIEICCTAHTNARVRHLVKSVIRGLKACQEPERPREGMGGTYFFMNENGRKVGILKPCDEEPLAPNNPKGYVGRQLGDPGWKPTVRVGEAAMREVAAYLLDHDGWAKVPTSVLVRARHPIFCYNNRMSSVRASSLDLAGKDSGGDEEEGDASKEGDKAVTAAPLPMKLGSLQEFVWHECDTSEMGTSRFSTSDVHRIGILDIRLFNTDRHAGNMLVRMPKEGSSADLKSRITAATQYELIPIDHGFCLPETLEAPYFEWLHWPQAMLPFSEEELAYIRRLDIEADKELLRKELPNLRPECLRVLEISTMLLKHCAEAGLTLFEIASIMTRPYEGGGEELSDLENFASYARTAIEEISESEAEDEGEEEEEEEDLCSMYEEDSSEDGREAGSADECSDGGEGLPVCAILDNVGMHGPYYGASSPEVGGVEEDVFGFGGGKSSDAIGNRRSPASSSSLSSADRLSAFSSYARSHNPFPHPISESDIATPPPYPASSGSKRRSGTGMSSAKAMSTRKNSGGGGGGGCGASGSMLGGTPIPAFLPMPSPFACAPPAFPSSVHITDGFLWRRLKGRQESHAKRRHASVAYKQPGDRPKHHRQLLSPQAYPPPVVAFAPDSLTGLFSGMDDSQWVRFTDAVQQQVGAALRAQQWKQDKHKDCAVAPMSCPRF